MPHSRISFPAMLLCSLLAWGSSSSSAGPGAGADVSCGVVERAGLAPGRRPSLGGADLRGGPVCPGCVIELHVLVDEALASELGAGTQAYVEDLVEAINGVWSAPQGEGGMELGVVLSQTTVFAGGDPWSATTDPLALLLDVNGYVGSFAPIDADGRDAVMLLTGVDLDGSTAGLSFVASLCGSSSVAIVQGSAFSFETVVSVANHQLGHLAGASHDGQGNACDPDEFIMAAAMNAVEPPTMFSGCSIEAMNAYIGDPTRDVLSCLAAPGGGCAADLTGDGNLNYFDVSAFLSAYASQGEAADFTGEGAFNFFDVSAFLIAFGAGCP